MANCTSQSIENRSFIARLSKGYDIPTSVAYIEGFQEGASDQQYRTYVSVETLLRSLSMRRINPINIKRILTAIKNV